MSYVFNMVGGGSGGSGPTSSDAILTVTVPTGSTVTMTKGGVTLTPTMWVQAADPTLDCALFVIPPSLFDAQNAWTVTATLSGDTASDTVTISTNNQYDLELAYGLYIIKSGHIVLPMSATDSLTDGDEYATFSTTTNYAQLAKLQSPIDTTGRSTLVIELETGSQSWFGGDVPSIGLSNSSPTISGANAVISSYVAKKAFGTSGNYQISPLDYSLDISSYTGSYYFWMSMSGASGGFNGRLYVKNFYLE